MIMDRTSGFGHNQLKLKQNIRKNNLFLYQPHSSGLSRRCKCEAYLTIISHYPGSSITIATSRVPTLWPLLLTFVTARANLLVSKK